MVLTFGSTCLKSLPVYFLAGNFFFVSLVFCLIYLVLMVLLLCRGPLAEGLSEPKRGGTIYSLLGTFLPPHLAIFLLFYDTRPHKCCMTDTLNATLKRKVKASALETRLNTASTMLQSKIVNVALHTFPEAIWVLKEHQTDLFFFFC